MLRVQPDEPLPHKPANPFAPPALHAAAGAAAAPTQTAKVAAVNPFAPKPAKEKKARVPKEVPAPVAVDVPAEKLSMEHAEAPADAAPAASQLDTDINSILSGLSMG